MSSCASFNVIANLSDPSNTTVRSIDLSDIKHVRSMTVGFNMIGSVRQTRVAGTVESIAQKFEEAGIPVKVLIDADKPDLGDPPVIIPVSNIELLKRRHDYTIVGLRDAGSGVVALNVKDKPETIDPSLIVK